MLKDISLLKQYKNFVKTSYHDDKDLIRHVRQKLSEKMSGNHRCYSTMKLADLMNIERDTLDDFSTDIFKKNQIAIITDAKAQSPDILREIAIVLERSGQYENALRVIERAIELRPKVPMLLKTRNRLLKKAKKTHDDNRN